MLGSQMRSPMQGSQMLGSQVFANQMSAPQKVPSQSYPAMPAPFAVAPLGGTAMIGSKRIRHASPTLYDYDVEWLDQDNLMHILAEDEGYQPL